FPSARITDWCDTEPRHKMTRKRFISEISAIKNRSQVNSSDRSGLFCGGTQRTALLIRAFLSTKPSFFCALYSPSANPAFLSASYKMIPAKSPVNGLPVAFAPFNPGAKPTTKSAASSSPNDGTAPLKNDGNWRLFSSRKATKRGQSGQSAGGGMYVIA